MENYFFTVVVTKNESKEREEKDRLEKTRLENELEKGCQKGVQDLCDFS